MFTQLTSTSLFVVLCLTTFSATTLIQLQVVTAQEPTEACPESIIDEPSCAAACSGGTSNDPGSYDFFILADNAGDEGDYLYSGFNCECQAADPPVFCTYTYSFPTCADANLTSCDGCAGLCDSLGFGDVGDCGGSPAIGCECEIVTLVNDGTTQVRL
jgi:hypothetical protein